MTASMQNCINADHFWGGFAIGVLIANLIWLIVIEYFRGRVQ